MTDDEPGDASGVHAPWYRAVFEHSPDGIILYDDEGTIAAANPRACENLGRDRDELVGRQLWRFTTGDPESARERWDAMAVGDTATFEGEHERADGTTFPVQVRLSRLDLGDDVAFVAIVRDITEHRDHEAELRTAHERIEFALETTDAVVFEIDLETERATRHGPFERLYGFPPSTATTPGTFLERAVHPDDRVAVGDVHRAVIGRDVESTEVTYRTNPDNGDVRWIRSVLARSDEGGDPSIIIGLSTDITAAVRHREALETLHAATRDLLAADSAEEIARIGSATATDALELSINSVNRYDPGTDALVPEAWSEENEAVFDGQPPSLPAGEGLVWRALETGEPQVYQDVHREDGVLNESTPFRSELHLPVGEDRVLLVSSTTPDAFDEADMALARVLAASLETAFDRLAHERELERQNERLEEFASVVSHDLRNPLTVAAGRLELLAEEVDSEHLEPMATALDRMERIIEDVLWLARGGRDIGALAPVDLAATVDACWQMVDPGEAALVVETHHEGDLGTVLADQGRLCQALENLLRNALEHGGEDVTVTVGPLDTGFFVEDDGPGIPEADRERVFDPGYSTSTAGTGFGLSIAREVIDAHGWTVRVTEGAGGGARFELTGLEFVDA